MELGEVEIRMAPHGTGKIDPHKDNLLPEVGGSQYGSKCDVSLGNELSVAYGFFASTGTGAYEGNSPAVLLIGTAYGPAEGGSVIYLILPTAISMSIFPFYVNEWQVYGYLSRSPACHEPQSLHW